MSGLTRCHIEHCRNVFCSDFMGEGTNEYLKNSNPLILICIFCIHENESISHPVMSDSVTLWIVARQAPLSMEFSGQEYLSG